MTNLVQQDAIERWQRYHDACERRELAWGVLYVAHVIGFLLLLAWVLS